MRHEVMTSFWPGVLYLNNGKCNRILFVEMAKWSDMFFLVRKAFRAWEMAFNYCNNLFFTLLQEANTKLFIWQVLQRTKALNLTFSHL